MDMTVPGLIAHESAMRGGQWLEPLWAEVEEMGLPLALLGEEQGGFGLSAAEQGEALMLLGKLAVPLPVAETMGALNDLRTAGKIRAIGVSNFSAAQIQEVADLLNETPDVVERPDALELKARATGEIVLDRGRARATPIVDVRNPSAHVTHEAAVGSVDKKQLETLMSRGMDEDAASELIIQGLLS